jgi:hypothetical protein
MNDDGQDRESYSDTQDRESYTVVHGKPKVRPNRLTLDVYCAAGEHFIGRERYTDWVGSRTEAMAGKPDYYCALCDDGTITTDTSNEFVQIMHDGLIGAFGGVAE